MSEWLGSSSVKSSKRHFVGVRISGVLSSWSDRGDGLDWYKVPFSWISVLLKGIFFRFCFRFYSMFELRFLTFFRPMHGTFSKNSNKFRQFSARIKSVSRKTLSPPLDGERRRKNEESTTWKHGNEFLHHFSPQVESNKGNLPCVLDLSTMESIQCSLCHAPGADVCFSNCSCKVHAVRLS